MAANAILPLVLKLDSLQIDDEAKYLPSFVKRQVGLLKNQLNGMTTSLKDADVKQHKSDLRKEQVRQLADLAFEAEDAIDLFLYEAAAQRQSQRHILWPADFIKLPMSLMIDSCKLGKKIKDITRKFRVIEGEIKELPTFEDGQTSAPQPHQGEAEEELAKLPHDRDGSTFDIHPLELDEGQTSAPQAHQGEAEEELAKLLMKEETLGGFGVVSIVGVDGSGKTTLAKKIYNRDDVKKHFDCRVCVRISRKGKTRMRDVFCDIIKQVMVLTEAQRKALTLDDVGIMEGRFSGILSRENNYLILMEDVRSEEDWDELKRNFPVPQNSQQWRVLLTTHDEGIARHANSVASYKLQLLDEEKGLELFYKMVLRGPVASLNEEMIDLAKKMVAKCDGLPLAIVVLGGLLSTQSPTVAVWKNVLSRVNWLVDSSNNCQKVLTLGYTELPDHLKLCFLYFGFFPEDTEIERDRLIRIWVAEGILRRRGNLDMEDVGGKFLNELMQRNLIQVAEWKSNGVPKSFIIHNLLLDLAISEANEGNFLNISTPQESVKYSHRVALHRDNFSEDTMPVPPCHFSWSSKNFLRSLLCSTTMSSLSFYGQLKLLKVLDLQDAPGIESLPNEIEKLIFLKYLSLCGTDLKTVPTWVGNLYNLQTLNLCKTKIEFIPIEIFKLKNLRHLLCFKWKYWSTSDDFIVESGIGGCQQLCSPRRNISQLKKLQTLWLRIGSWIEGGLETLTNLRELVLTGSDGGLRDKTRKALSQALIKLESLEVLFLEEREFPGLHGIFTSFSGHMNLYDLTFVGVMEKLPKFSDFPPNLTRLQLGFSHLKKDMMVILEKLPNLKDLTLGFRPYDGVSMECSAGGFPKLEFLTLIRFDCLRCWMVEEGAMPNLKILEINSLFGLKCIPHGLRYITTLQQLTLSMPKEFLERVKQGGKDWEKIKHVPCIKTRELQIPTYISQELQCERRWLEPTKSR